MDKNFLKWIVNTHPEIVDEYRSMLKGAMSELEEIISKGENIEEE